MNKVKKMLRALVMIILILCGILGFILANKEEIEIYDEMATAEEVESFEMDYYIVSECIKQYEEALKSLNTITNIEEKNQIVNSLYNMTTKEYINKYNITKENLLENLIINNLQNEFSIISMSKIEGNVNKYHTYVQIDEGREINQFDIIVFLDENNATFSIMQEYIQEVPTRTYEEIVFVTEEIEKNEDNSYSEFITQYYIETEGGAPEENELSKVEEKKVEVIALSEPRRYNSEEYIVTEDFDAAGWTASKAVVEEYGPLLNINTIGQYYSKGNEQEYEAFMNSLGGLFAKYGGKEKYGTGDSVSLMEAQEYVYSVMWMMGFDYCANDSYSTRCTAFCKSKNTNIYSAYYPTSYHAVPHHNDHNFKTTLDDAMIEQVFTTNCNYTIDKVFYEAGLMGENSKITHSHQVKLGNPKSVTSHGGTVVTKVSDLQFGDIIALPGHWMYVGEETEDTIVLYKTGHDFTDGGSIRKEISKSADNSALGSQWTAGHFWDLEYDPSLVNRNDMTIEDDEGNLILNALINLLTTILDAIQSLFSKVMTGVSFSKAEVLVSDVSAFPNINLLTFEDGSSWLGSNNEIQQSTGTSEAMDTSGEGVMSENDGKVAYYVDATNYKSNYKYVSIIYSPEEIFADKVDILSVNFFETTNESGVWGILRNTIAYWFRALRYIGIVGLLSVLIYIGIKTMISSSASQKADFKKEFMNWIIGIVILFLLPYIMSFILYVGTELTELFVPSGETIGSVDVYVYDGGSHIDKSTYSKFSTNLMGLVRFQSQNNNTSKRIGYVIMYLMLIIMTIRFTIMYLKRMIYMAYLTMISPIVAVMYPLDKSNGGGAESFNEWIKGYTVNAFIQPIHLLTYNILIGSAMSFASDNLLYTIVVLGFMTQLEHLIRQIFGLEGGRGMGAIGGLGDSALGMSSVVSTVTNVASMIGNNISNAKNSSKDDKTRIQDSSNEDEVNYSKDFNTNSDNSDEDSRDISSDNESQSDEENSSNSQNLNQTEDNDDENNNDSSDNGNHDSNNADNVDDSNNNDNYSDENSNEEDNDSTSGKDENTTGEKSSSHTEGENTKKVSKTRLKGKKGAIRKMAEERLFKVGYNMGYRRGQGLKQNAKNIAKKAGKKAIKGVRKGVKIGGALTIGAGAALGQAAVSLAMDGRYNILEGVGTIATVGSGANKLMDTAGKKVGNLNKEYKQSMSGDEEAKRKQRVKDFRSSKEAYNLYEREYMDKGSSEMSRRLNLGEKIAADGIVNPSEQIEVMNYIDSMVDRDLEKKYGTMNDEQRAAKAEEIWKMRNDERYVKTAVTTAKARKEIPADKINATDKEWNSFAASMSAGDKDTMRGYNQARTNIRAMNAAQRKKKK